MQFYYALIFAAAAAIAAAQTSGCAGGISEGQDSVSGAYYYTCKSGSLVPGGCMSGTQTKIPVGGTFTAGNVQMTCVSDGTSLTVKATGCVTDNGQSIAAGQFSESGTVYFQCMQDGDGVNLQVAGCLAGGQRVEVDKTVVQGSQVMQCSRTSNKDAKLIASGCVVNGQQVDIGTQVDDTDTSFHCKKTGDTTTLDPVACINDGKRVYDLDVYKKGSIAYRCRVNGAKASADLYGCSVTMPDGTTDIKSLKCTWDVGSDPINYVNSCVQMGDKAVVTQMACLYTYMKGRIQVDEGCYRVFDKVAAGCQRASDGSLKMDTFDPKDLAAAASRGLRQC